MTGPATRIVAPAGLSIAQILDSIVDLPLQFSEEGIVCVNGVEVPRSQWRRVKPRARTNVVVTLHLPMHGFWSSAKKYFALAATIAVVAVATVVTGGAAAPLLGAAFAGGTFGAALLGGAIGIGGALAIGALTAAPSLDQSGSGTTASVGNLSAAGGSTGAPTGSAGRASLVGNVLSPGGAVPRVIGSHRVYPPAAANVLVEVIEDDEIAEAVFVLAGPHEMTDARAGNVAFDDIDGLESEFSEGRPDSAIQTLVSRQSYTQSQNIELSGPQVDLSAASKLLDQGNPLESLPKWHSFVSRADPHEVWINLVWSQGLFITTLPGEGVSQAFRVRFRKRGDVSWVNCPEVHFMHNRVGSIQKTIRLVWGDEPDSPSYPPTAFGPIYAFRSVPGQTVGPTMGGWTADAHFSTGAGDNLLSLATFYTTGVRNTELRSDRAIFYLDPDVFPPDGQYEVQVMRSSAYQYNQLTPSTYVYGGSDVHDLFGYRTISDVHYTIADQSVVLGRVGVARFVTIWNENPVQSKDFAHFAVKIKNQTLDQISLEASGLVPDWDGTEWAGLVATSNPAPHLRDVMVGRLAADPLPVSLLDDDELLDFRQHCIDEDYACDAVIEGQSGRDALVMIAACGRAQPRQSEKWGVVIDADTAADTPVQVFSPRNMADFRFERVFLKLPHGFRVRFDDSDDDDREREIIVMDPDLIESPGNLRLEDVRYDGLVTEADAIDRANFDFRQARHRFVYYYGSAPAEAIVCRRGDLVAVQHDVIAAHAGYARIKEIVTLSGDVTGLVLDGTIPVPDEDAFSAAASALSSYSSAFETPRTGVAIRCLDGTLLTAEITALSTASSIIEFVTPFTDPGLSVLAPDCLVVSGPLGSEYSRLKVLDINYRKGLTAEIVFVPEAPEIWQ